MSTNSMSASRLWSARVRSPSRTFASGPKAPESASLLMTARTCAGVDALLSLTAACSARSWSVMAAISGRLVHGTIYAVPLLAKSRRIAISPSRSSSQTRAMRSAGASNDTAALRGRCCANQLRMIPVPTKRPMSLHRTMPGRLHSAKP